jgi:glutathione S-transferase
VKDIIPYAINNLAKVFTVLDEQLKGKNHMVDNKFSAVDIMIGYILTWYPEQLAPFSYLKNYCQNLQQRPAYKRSIQD